MRPRVPKVKDFEPLDGLLSSAGPQNTGGERIMSSLLLKGKIKRAFPRT